MIYFIGAGPGPVELITVKGKDLLEQADLIIYPEPPINLQLLDYDEYVAVEHIVSRHSRDFSKNIDIHKLFVDIKKSISDEYYVGKLVLNDIYDIPYEGIGDSDVLRVICIPGTKNILSMYPLINKLDFDDGMRLEKR